MNLRSKLSMFGCGVAFGGGLAASGLTRPELILGFLDVTGDWDPRLGIVMAIATGVNAVAVRVASRRLRPWWAAHFHLPVSARIDARLLAGAVLFGIGWGLVGVCPGPALVSVAAGHRSMVTFVLAMAAGLALVDAGGRRGCQVGNGGGVS